MKDIFSKELQEELLVYYKKKKRKKNFIIMFGVFAVVFFIILSLMYTYKKNQISVKNTEIAVEYGESFKPQLEEVIDFSSGKLSKDDIKIECDIQNEKGKQYPAIGEYELKIKKNCKINYLKYFHLPFKDEITLPVKVEDTTPPQITAPEKIEVLVNSDIFTEDYLYLFKVTDLSEIQDITLDTSEVDTTQIGEYKIKAIAEDFYGNEAKVDVKCFVINDPNNPTAPSTTQTLSYNTLKTTSKSVTVKKTTANKKVLPKPKKTKIKKVKATKAKVKKVKTYIQTTTIAYAKPYQTTTAKNNFIAKTKAKTFGTVKQKQTKKAKVKSVSKRKNSKKH